MPRGRRVDRLEPVGPQPVGVDALLPVDGLRPGEANGRVGDVGGVAASTALTESSSSVRTGGQRPGVPFTNATHGTVGRNRRA